jgi:hypothetical protein
MLAGNEHGGSGWSKGRSKQILRLYHDADDVYESEGEGEGDAKACQLRMRAAKRLGVGVEQLSLNFLSATPVSASVQRLSISDVNGHDGIFHCFCSFDLPGFRLLDADHLTATLLTCSAASIIAVQMRQQPLLAKSKVVHTTVTRATPKLRQRNDLTHKYIASSTVLLVHDDIFNLHSMASNAV